jgi:hypothetical protein
LLTFTPRDEADPRPSRSAAIAATAGAVALLILAALLGRASTAPSAADPVVGASVTIDGQVYPFDPETCLITDDGFVASGRGEMDDDTFVASVSKIGGVQVAFGVANEVDQPAPDHLWWSSDVLRQSRVEGTSVRATAKVLDRSGSVEGPRTAVVNVTCPTAP